MVLGCEYMETNYESYESSERSGNGLSASSRCKDRFLLRDLVSENEAFSTARFAGLCTVARTLQSSCQPRRLKKTRWELRG